MLPQLYLFAGMTRNERAGWQSTFEVDEELGLELLLRCQYHSLALRLDVVGPSGVDLRTGEKPSIPCFT